jgi:DNA invertase Pin-like site-specific DNA recombinase
MRISQVKADQRARGHFLGGARPFGFQITGEGKQKRLVPDAAEQAAVSRMIALKAEGKSLRAIAAEIAASGFNVSHVAVQKALAQAMREDA